MDSGGPEQITVMSDCTKACACVCTGFRFSRPPALHLMFPSPLPVFFPPFFFLFLSFRSHSSFLSLFSALELWPEPAGWWSTVVFCREQKSFVWKKKKKKMGLSLATLFANNLHVLVSLLVLDWLSVLFTVALADK